MREEGWKNLEKFFGIMAIIGFGFAIILSNNFTGSAVLDHLGIKEVSFAGGFFLVKGLIFAFAWVWAKKHHKKIFTH